MKHFITFILIIAFSAVKAQDSTEKENVDLRRFIQKNISVDGDNFVNDSSEFFILDIKLNKFNYTIENIDYFRKSTSQHFKFIDTVITLLKAKWHPPNGFKYNRLIIPVFFIFSSADTLKDYPIDFEIKKNNSANGTCLVEKIIILIHSTLR